MKKPCNEPGCDQPAIARGYCGRHYMQQKRAGRMKPIASERGLPVEQRFWRFVLKTEDCWLWTGGSVTKKGYGQIQLTNSRKHVLVHRLSYEMHHGPIPTGMVVMHLCDNPACVNPAHLKVGTQSENIIESFKKGRKVCIPPLNYGEKQRSAVLTEEKVRYMRASDKTHAEIARELGVSESAVQRARNRTTWKHIPC